MTFIYFIFSILIFYILIAAILCISLLSITKDYKRIISLYLRSTSLFLVGIPITILGYPIVALALLFRKNHIETTHPFTKYSGTWMLVSLPSWAKPWDNSQDGALGDERGWWNNYCRAHYNEPCTSFYSMWQWLAVRNPANRWSRVITGVDISKCKIIQLYRNKCCQFLEAIREDNKKFWLFEGFIKYPSVDYGFEWRLGHKIELNDVITPNDCMRGSVYRIRPWKHI